MKCTASLSLIVLTLILGCMRKPAPAELFNQDAAIPADAPIQPLDWRVITSSINPAQQTMATLFGNDAAIESARTSAHTTYPSGSILALVTWSQKEDPHWFGGRMPSRFQSMEIVRVTSSADGSPIAAYQRLEGPSLQDVSGKDVEARKIDILAQRASVMP